MDEITVSQVRKLSEDRHGQCVSLYLPTHPAGTEAQQDQVRLKQLIERAEVLLEQHGMRAPDARELLKPVRGLPVDEPFWNKRQQGLAVFVARNELHPYRLPHRFEELVVVNRRFHVKPLLPLLVNDQPFFILALSKGSPRLIRATRFSAEQVHIDNMPAEIDVALNLVGGSQVHAASRGSDLGRPGTAFQGGVSETSKEETVQYFRLVSSALRPVLREQRIPLVIAAVDYLIPLFKQTCDYPHMLDKPVLGNPDYQMPQQLQEKAWPIVEQHANLQRQAATAKFQQLAGTGKVSDNILEVAPAALQGKVDSLLLDCRTALWGEYDVTTGKVEVRDEPQPGDEDLVDLSAVATLNSRGNVFTFSREQMPTHSPVAAIFRY